MQKRLTAAFLLIIMMSSISGCTLADNIAVKLNMHNSSFEYIKQSKVDKIIIQNVRDSGFKFIVNDAQAIDDIYKILKKGKTVSEKSSLDPDYVFEVWIGDEVKTYNYIVGTNEKGKGNFYNDKEFFIVPKTLENTIMQNLSFIRKPRDFEYIYYQSIMEVLKKKKETLSGNPKVGIDISQDTDCLKYMFSVDLIDFNEKLQKQLSSAEIAKNDVDYDVIITVKNRGYSTTVFKTLITVENNKDKTSEKYYVQAEYNYKDWDIEVSESDEKPSDW